jgi:hypothetical protein
LGHHFGLRIREDAAHHDRSGKRQQREDESEPFHAPSFSIDAGSHQRTAGWWRIASRRADVNYNMGLVTPTPRDRSLE